MKDKPRIKRYSPKHNHNSNNQVTSHASNHQPRALRLKLPGVEAPGQTWVKRNGRRMREGWGGGGLATFGTWLGQVQTWHGRGVSKGLDFRKGERHVGTTFWTWPKRDGGLVELG
ncbi:hypothetical protein PIB30_095995 [Stylosanthes scabra]|uniref:Uncharacterized protein n=1 Tax=Stylosanthes scabra TaxID=79078 RepID=A0ABU6TWL0_9FABA|nr:hypothetical protein [Stylosanthes scabra]